MGTPHPARYTPHTFLASLFGSALPDGVGSLVTENVLSAAHVLRFEGQGSHTSSEPSTGTTTNPHVSMYSTARSEWDNWKFLRILRLSEIFSLVTADHIEDLKTLLSAPHSE